MEATIGIVSALVDCRQDRPADHDRATHLAGQDPATVDLLTDYPRVPGSGASE